MYCFSPILILQRKHNFNQAVKTNESQRRDLNAKLHLNASVYGFLLTLILLNKSKNYQPELHLNASVYGFLLTLILLNKSKNYQPGNKPSSAKVLFFFLLASNGKVHRSTPSSVPAEYGLTQKREFQKDHCIP